MKKVTLKGLLIVLSLLCCHAAHAYDLSKKTDGVYTYYNKLYDEEGNEKTHTGLYKSMELTYETDSYNSYSGTIHIVDYVIGSNLLWYYTEGIGKRACYNCTDLTTVEYNNESGTGNGAGNTLYIDDEAFANCTSLTTFHINKTCIASIGDSAFYKCSSLTEEGLSAFPNTLETIGNYAFAYCTSFTTLDLSGTKLTSIGDYAFYNCTNLTEIKLPKTLTSIGKNAFSGCNALVTIDYDAESCAPATGGTLPVFPYVQTLTIGSDVEAISTNMFSVDNLTTLTFDAPSLTTTTFQNCTTLTTLTIGADVTRINENLFSGCTGLTDLTYNAKSCTDAGSGPFTTCTALETVTFGSSVTSLPSYLFYCCTGLTTVTGIENLSITEIPDYLFGGTYQKSCSSLAAITIPSKVTRIGDYAFYYSGITSVTYNATACDEVSSNAFSYTYVQTITFDSAVKSLPENLCYYWSYLTTVNNLENTKVTAIPSSMFCRCTSLKEITLPTAVTSLGANAFDYCYDLTTVNNLGNTKITTIGYGAFDNCTSLEEITLPTTVTSFGGSAFKGCTKLKTIKNFPSLKITEIPSRLFCDCTSLEEITIPTTVTSFSQADILYVNYTWYEASEAFMGCTSLKTINNLSSLKITEIPRYTFNGCSSLESITIPSKVTSIGDYAFYGCTSLTDVAFNATNCTSAGSASYPTFKGCTALKTVTVDSNVETLPSCLFYGCTALETIDIADTKITIIGDSLFYNCSALTAITIPSRVTSIGTNAFCGCTSLAEVNYNAVACTATNSTTYHGYWQPPFNNCDALMTVTFGSDVEMLPSSLFSGLSITTLNGLEDTKITSIGDSVFYGCGHLTEITLPTTVTSLGTNVFCRCTGLEKINNFGSLNITEIPAYLFYDCRSLEEITLPTTVTSFGTVEPYSTVYSNCFYDCSSLKKVNNFGDLNITEIPNYLFSLCSSLEEITIPATVTTFGTYVFDSCTSLTTVNNFEDLSITEVPSYLFNGCSSLEEITLPTTVTSFGTCVFSDCTSLTTVNNFENLNITKVPSYLFNGCSSLVNISIPSTVTTIGAYAFSNTAIEKIEIPSNVTSVGQNAFTDCTSLVEVAYNAEDATIYRGGSNNYLAFRGCTALATAIIGSRVKTIPAYLFYNCTSLATLTVNSTILESIGNYAFYNCPIIRLDLSNTALTSVGSGVFGGCTSLQEVDLPASLTTITGVAFYKCTAMTMVTVANGSNSYSANDGILFSKDGTTLVYYPAGRSDTAFDIPEDVTTIGEYAFNSCTLETITIPSNITTIGSYAFYNCTALTAIDIPNSVTSLGSDVLANCTALTTVNGLGDTSIESIPDYAFYQCSALNSIDIPDAVTSIGSYAFYSCSSLDTLTFGEDSQLATIGTLAFQLCTGLKSIMFPSSVTSIGFAAFDDCTSLESIYSYAVTPATCGGNSVFYDVPSTCVLYVPAGSEKEYGDYSSSYSDDWSSLSTVRTFHLLDVTAKADPEVQGNEEGYGYMTYYNDKYTYTLPEGMKASTVTALGSGDKLTMKWEYNGDDPDKAVVPAYTAVVLYGPIDEFMAMTDYDETDTTADKYGTIVDAGSVDDNWLHGVWTTDELYTGDGYSDVVFGYDADGNKTVDGYLFYTLNFTDVDENGIYKNIGFYWGAEDGKPFEYTSGVKKAWLAMPSDSSTEAKFDAFLFGGADNEATGIRTVDTSTSDRYGSGDGYIYNLAGQRVNDMNRRGVYIVNGRKVAKK